MSFRCMYITVWSLLSDLAQPSWMDKWTETYIPTRWRMCQVLFPSTSWVASYHFKHIVQLYSSVHLWMVYTVLDNCFVFYMFLFLNNFFFSKLNFCHIEQWLNSNEIAMQPGWWEILRLFVNFRDFPCHPTNDRGAAM